MTKAPQTTWRKTIRSTQNALLLLGATLGLLGCGKEVQPVSDAAPDETEHWAQQREDMVQTQLQFRDIVSTPVLAAMRKVERHKFVPPALHDQAYNDHPLPIGKNQTISQPYIVAFMCQLLAPQPGDKMLEIGTGSGYAAAVLAETVDQVYTIEIIESLGLDAAERLDNLGYTDVHVRVGDGYKGWPEQAPFDGIVVTAAPGHVPQPLKDQLKIGAHLVIPVGPNGAQFITVITRTEDGFRETKILPVRFVPMTGQAQQ